MIKLVTAILLVGLIATSSLYSQATNSLQSKLQTLIGLELSLQLQIQNSKTTITSLQSKIDNLQQQLLQSNQTLTDSNSTIQSQGVLLTKLSTLQNQFKAKLQEQENKLSDVSKEISLLETRNKTLKKVAIFAGFVAILEGIYIAVHH